MVGWRKLPDKICSLSSGNLYRYYIRELLYQLLRLHLVLGCDGNYSNRELDSPRQQFWQLGRSYWCPSLKENLPGGRTSQSPAIRANHER